MLKRGRYVIGTRKPHESQDVEGKEENLAERGGFELPPRIENTQVFEF